MSGSVLEEKENVYVVHEFAKEDTTFTTTSILKPSQKANVGQLTPNKAPKVTFKNTPLCHHPVRYKAEQPIEQRDSWELIRSLDEEENWTERTQVVTKEDHQIHLEAAKEVLDQLIDSLPCFINPEKDCQQAVEELESQDPGVTSPVESKEQNMDDGLDIAGPLDPAIASLNSLLKAGEDEEIAFSPIGSGNNSPDGDNMVTSDDIEKLLAPHDMTDDLDIPSLELIHGNKIDALMDSKFSGKHLDEVAAKLHELKFSSKMDTNNEDDFDELPIKRRGAKNPQQIVPSQDEKNDNCDDLPIKPRGGKAWVVIPQEDNSNDFDNLPIKPRGGKSQVVIPKEENTNDFDNLPIKPRGAKQPQDSVVLQDSDEFDNLPIKPRGAKKPSPKEEVEKNEDDDIDLPIKPRGGKKSPVNVESEKKEIEEVKENGNGEGSPPVKRRQPKAAAPKKDGEPGSDEEKEKFKKPMPPKPWKTKKKKAPQTEDPFMVMFAEPAQSISTNQKPTENQKPSANNVSQETSGGANVGSSNELVEEKHKAESERLEEAGDGMDGVTFTDTQDDFGFSNEDFQPGNEFSLELDYLEKFGNSNNLDRLSALARQSLYVKFDPLCKGRSPDQQALQKKVTEANASKQTAGNNGDLLLNTPPNRRAAQNKLSSIKEGETTKKAASDFSDVDKLLTFSPVAKGDQQSKPEETQRTETTPTLDDDGALVQPLLYSKSDIENAVKKEREALLKQTHEESKLRDMEIQDILSKLQTEVEKNAKLKRENDELKTVMKEYEKTMTEMVESMKKDKDIADESKNEITKERDQLQADLNSVEAAFSDLHRRYEKMKGVLENFKKNEEILKKAAQDYQEKLRKSSEKYQMLKKHAEEKIETANIEINRVRRSNDSEMAVMRAALKKEQNKSASLEQAIQQKINENKELTAICDELIQRASSK